MLSHELVAIISQLLHDWLAIIYYIRRSWPRKVTEGRSGLGAWIELWAGAFGVFLLTLLLLMESLEKLGKVSGN